MKTIKQLLSIAVILLAANALSGCNITEAKTKLKIGVENLQLRVDKYCEDPDGDRAVIRLVTKGALSFMDIDTGEELFDYCEERKAFRNN